MEQNNFCERVLSLPAHLSIGAKEFCRRLNKSESYLGTFKRTKHGPSIDVVYKILSAFPEVSKLWLIFGEGDVFDTNAIFGGDNSSEGVNSNHILDYKTLYDELRIENNKYREESRQWRDAMLETMKKNEALVIENAQLKIEMIASYEQPD